MYDVDQHDSTLQISNGIPVTRNNKFRNQRVIITVAVPVGKRIKVNMNGNWVENLHINFGPDDNYDNWSWEDHDAYQWDDNIEYIMTNDGLKPVHPEDVIKHDDDNDGQNSLDDLQQQLNDIQRQIDESQNLKQEKMKELEQRKKEIEDMINKNKMQQDSIKSDSTGYHYKATAFYLPVKRSFFKRTDYSNSSKLIFQQKVFNRFL